MNRLPPIFFATILVSTACNGILDIKKHPVGVTSGGTGGDGASGDGASGGTGGNSVTSTSTQNGGKSSAQGGTAFGGHETVIGGRNSGSSTSTAGYGGTVTSGLTSSSDATVSFGGTSTKTSASTAQGGTVSSGGTSTKTSASTAQGGTTISGGTVSSGGTSTKTSASTAQGGTVNVGGTTSATGGSSSTGGTTTIDPCSMNLTKTSWDVTADFSASKNPCGVWTYGYKSTVTSQNLVVYSVVNTIDFGAGGLGHSWNDPNNLNGTDRIPSVFRNPPTNTTINGIEPGQVALHGGANGEASLVRFTAPRAGTYSFSFEFFPGDIWETEGKIVRGTEGVYSKITSISPAYSSDFQMQAGETIDVMVVAQGNGSGGWYYAYGSTPITVTVTQN